MLLGNIPLFSMMAAAFVMFSMVFTPNVFLVVEVVR